MGRTAGGGDGCRRYAPTRSGVAERKGDEMRPFVRLHPQQQSALARLAGFADRVTDVSRRRNSLSADLENHVTSPEPVISRRPVRIDVGDDHAFLAAGARNFAGARERQSKLRHVSARGLVLLLLGGLRTGLLL